MPFTDPEKKRTYHRDYMRRRGVVKPTPEPVLNPESAEMKYNPREPHKLTMHKIDGRWRRTIEQDERLFEQDSGEELNVGHSRG